MIEKARGDDLIADLFKLLAALTTKNPTELNFDFESLIKSKLLQMHTSGMLEVSKITLDLAFDQLDAHLRLIVQDNQFQSELIPKLIHAEKLNLTVKLLQDIAAEDGCKLLELLSTMLSHRDNLVLFN
jgi:hypothetical protein